MSAMTWPTDRFFWAVLEAPGVRAGVLPSGLEADLQEALPVPVEMLHAVCVPAAGGVLVCAARRDDLQGLGPDVLSVRPEAVPDCVESTSEVPELMTGSFEPLAFKRERSKRHLLAAASALLACALISLGFERRAGSLMDQGRAASAAELELTARVALSGEARSLGAQLDQARRSMTSDRALTPPDAAEALAAVLTALPNEVDFEASSISISPSAMSLALTTKEDARQLLAAVRAPQGWRLDEPRLTTLPNANRVNLTMRRAAGGQP
jgi:hypothetical protein